MIYSYSQNPKSAKLLFGNNKCLQDNKYSRFENGLSSPQAKINEIPFAIDTKRIKESYTTEQPRKALADLSSCEFNKRYKTIQSGNFQVNGRINDLENANQASLNALQDLKITFKEADDHKFVQQDMKHEIEEMIKDKLASQNYSCTEECKSFKYDMGKFYDLFQNYLQQKKKKIDWQKIKPVNPNKIKSYAEIKEKCDTEGLLQRVNFKRVTVLKLNGGLGTAMGCEGPKLDIEIRDEKTILDLTIQQIRLLNSTDAELDVPLILMNSFNTAEKTKYSLQKYDSHKVNILTFNQNRFPRIGKTTLMPIVREIQNNQTRIKTKQILANCSSIKPSTYGLNQKEIRMLPYNKRYTYFAENEPWYPPGHGDLFQRLDKSGLLNEMLVKGKDILFVSNIDNLGATVDASILAYMITNNITYIMEVTEKTKIDNKGGLLIEYQENEISNIRLLEEAQIPQDQIKNFNDSHEFKNFNTNNIWINLNIMRKLLRQKSLKLEVIQKEKNLEGIDQKIIQLETAIGSAIQNFPSAIVINVPRKRYLPIKSTSDLLLLQSDLYTLSYGELIMSQKILNNRHFSPIPIIKLGPHFKKVKDYLERISQGVPSLLECDQISICGDVSFGQNVILKGTVIIVANQGSHIDIPSGTILQDKVITGNFHTLEH